MSITQGGSFLLFYRYQRKERETHSLSLKGDPCYCVVEPLALSSMPPKVKVDFEFKESEYSTVNECVGEWMIQELSHF